MAAKLICAALLASAPAAAFAQAQSILNPGIKTANAANGLNIMNPPLPMLHWREGEQKLSLQPSLFKSDYEFVFDDGTRVDGEFEGFGLGAGWSRGLSERWAVYAALFGTRVTGDGTRTGLGGVARPFVHDNKTTFVTAAAAVVYRLYGDADGGFTVPVFIGPAVSRYSATQRVTQRSSGLENDFDMEADWTYAGIFAGAQTGVDVGASFRVVPYVTLFYRPRGEADIEVTTVRFDDIAASGCSLAEGCGLGKVFNERLTVFPGLNLVYRPWSLSVNISTIFLDEGFVIGRHADPEIGMTSLTFSKSFGNYRR